MFNNMANPYNNGYTFGVARPAARNTQPLTAEQIQKLRTKPEGFDMKVTQEDLWRAACTHKEKTGGGSTLIFRGEKPVKDEKGDVIYYKRMYECTICGEVFEIPEYLDTERVKKTVEDMLSWLQVCKTIYVDAPEDVVTQYFQLIALLKKFMSLWEVSVRNFSHYTDDEGVYANPIGGSPYGFNALNQLLSNPWAAQQAYAPPAAMGQYQQPMMGMAPNNQYAAPGMMPQQYQQPMGGAAPVNQWAPAPGMMPQQYQQPMAMDPNANPVAYGYPQQPMMAQAPGVVPPTAGTAAPTAAPSTETVPAEVQQVQTFNV